MAEPSAAALTALRITTETRAAMASALTEMTAHGAGTPKWHEGRLRFHELVLSGAGNELLGSLWPSIRVILEWVNSLRTPGEHIGSGDEAASYAQTFAKLGSGDAEGAMIAMAHLIDMDLNEALHVLRRVDVAMAKTDRSAAASNL